MILAYLEAGHLERRACVHQIKLWWKKNATETLNMLREEKTQVLG
jgi:hypothetical protein